MKNFLLQLFTWWNGQTMGTRFFTWRKGEYVGSDEFGNKYYRNPNVPPLGERRWVIYNGIAEASKIPAGWHGWMHHRTDTPPTRDGYQPRAWEKPHQPNMTGTAMAHRPKGSILTADHATPASGNYTPWAP
ncbi:MAG: NADH:ubiquinone oxidoreductase subunit NDUFA12 [Hyphomicrobiales bacterium]